MIKILGAIFIIFSCISLSRIKIKASVSSLAALHLLIGELNEMADNISFYKKPLPEIIVSLKDREEDIFFKKVFSCSQSGKTIPESWENALIQDDLLPENAKKVLKDLGKNIGNNDANQETKNIHFSIRELENILSETNTDSQKNVKMLKSFGVLSGLLIVILFI
ncbi:MAG: hypothetical protein E7407_03620 [Ruminococcaceae bacterium]|nr:hypothetical protein [Oscillospiraceae bacterium]